MFCMYISLVRIFKSVGEFLTYFNVYWFSSGLEREQEKLLIFLPEYDSKRIQKFSNEVIYWSKAKPFEQHSFRGFFFLLWKLYHFWLNNHMSPLKVKFTLHKANFISKIKVCSKSGVLLNPVKRRIGIEIQISI